MSRALKRPMFKRGGPANDGIMSGIVDREKKANGDIGLRTEEILSAMQQYAPLPKTRLPLGTVGLALAQGAPLVDALGAGYTDFVKRDDARRAALAKRKASAVATAIGEKSAIDLAKTKALLKDPRIATEQKVDYVKKII